MTTLSQLRCLACRRGEPTLTELQVKEVDGEKHLERVFKFNDFAAALDFTNKVGAIAEREDHHPLIVTEYGRATVDCWTHAIGGLHQNGFIMAAKSDQAHSRQAS